MVAVSNHLKLAFAWIAALNQMNLEKLASMIPDDFVSMTRPASAGFTPADKKEYMRRMSIAPFKTFNISIPAAADIVETPDVVQFYTTSNGRTLHGFPWKNEYMFTFTFASDKLIKSVTEFTDPTVITSQLGKETTVAEAQFNCPKK